MNLNHSSAFSCSSFSPCLPFSPDHHLHLSHPIMFFIGAVPPLSLDLSAGRKQPLAVVFDPFCHFSVTFIATIQHIHPELRFFSNSFQTSSVITWPPPGKQMAPPPMILTGPSFYCRRRTRLNVCILLLLIIGGVEVNPGPSSSVNLTFGMLNTRSVVNKTPLLHSLIADNDLSFLALTETWIKTDDPRWSKMTQHHLVTELHMYTGKTLIRPGVVALQLSIRTLSTSQPRNHNITHSSFEFQLVNIGLKSPRYCAG